MHLVIWCVWCSNHEFKVDARTAEDAGIVELICPECGKVTDVNKRSDGTLAVRPHPAEGSNPGQP